MIEIYLNPDNDTMGGEVFENLGDIGWVAVGTFHGLMFFCLIYFWFFSHQELYREAGVRAAGGEDGREAAEGDQAADARRARTAAHPGKLLPHHREAEGQSWESSGHFDRDREQRGE